MIDIVMVTFNRIKFTLDAMRYLAARTRTPFRLIIVDNGSTDVPPQVLPTLADKCIQLDKNYGLEYAKNVGLAEVQSEYFVSTDNDILCPLLDPDWLAQEIALLDAHPEYAAIALRPQVFVGGLPGIPFEKVEGDIKECAHVGGVLRIMRTQVVRGVGGWGNAPGRGHEELVICGKLRSAGFQVGYAKNLHAWHCFGTADAPWGYEDVPLESHGHSAVQPPVWVYDTDEYRAKFDPLTFAPKE